MNAETPAAPSPFVEGTQLQFAWDSTSLGYLKECPRKYFYTIVEGWRGKGQSVHLEFGGLYHKALEEYDKLRAREDPHDETLAAVVSHVLWASYPLALRPQHEDSFQSHPLDHLVSRPVRERCRQDRSSRGRVASCRAFVSLRTRTPGLARAAVSPLRPPRPPCGVLGRLLRDGPQDYWINARRLLLRWI
jgi:hypothetical protein